MPRKKLLFIINPISGATRKAGVPKLIEEVVDTNIFEPEIYFTNYRGDAERAAAEARDKGIDTVVAVGGDGTINEIASQLTASETSLGIIPLGSGNGLARHLQIPINSKEAMKLLNSNRTNAIDAAYLNGRAFFNVAGIGFDAYVGYLFATIPGRGFSAYARATYRALGNFKPFTVKISSENETLFEGKAFLLSFANSNQFGNNCYINPDGKLDDGRLEIVLLKPFPKILTPFLIWQLFAKSIKSSRFVEVWSLDKASIEVEKPMAVQIDGDVIGKAEKVELNIEHRALKIMH